MYLTDIKNSIFSSYSHISLLLWHSAVSNCLDKTLIDCHEGRQQMEREFVVVVVVAERPPAWKLVILTHKMGTDRPRVHKQI